MLPTCEEMGNKEGYQRHQEKIAPFPVLDVNEGQIIRIFSPNLTIIFHVKMSSLKAPIVQSLVAQLRNGPLERGVMATAHFSHPAFKGFRIDITFSKKEEICCISYP